MPKILIVNTSFELGGVEIFFAQVCQRYQEKGYECHFISLIDSYPVLSEIGIQKESIRVIFPGLLTKPTFPQVLRRWKKVDAIMKEFQYEAIFTGLYLPAMPVWISNVIFRRQKVFYFLLQTADYMVRHKWFWKSGLMKRGNTYVIAISNYLLSSYRSLFPGYEHQFRTCILPVDTQRFHPRDSVNCRLHLTLPLNKKIVGICSRLSPEKGFAIVLEALRYIKDPSILCVVFGSGPMAVEIDDLRKRYALEDKLIILAPRKDTEIIYNAFDLYWQAGKGPSLGLSTLEAFASGIPNIIVTRNAEEVVMAEDTFAGYEAGLITSAQPEIIAADIEQLLYSQKLSQMKSEARRLAEQVYNWNTFLNALMPLHRDTPKH